MKYMEVSVLRYEIVAGEMQKEGKWSKNIPDDNWDRRKREGNERKRGKMINDLEGLPTSRRLEIAKPDYPVTYSVRNIYERTR